MSSEYLATDNYAYHIAAELTQNQSIQGEPYHSIALTTDQPGFVDTYDPNMAYASELLSLDWPGNSPHGNRFETIRLFRPDADSAEDITTVRSAILGASIGSAALGRISDDLRLVWEEMKQMHAVPIDYLRDRCALLGIPLAVCQTSRVVESEVIPEGARMMHLWYPIYVSPTPVLATLKEAVRDMIARETI